MKKLVLLLAMGMFMGACDKAPGGNKVILPAEEEKIPEGQVEEIIDVDELQGEEQIARDTIAVPGDEELFEDTPGE